MHLKPLDVDECVRTANHLLELLSEAGITPSSEVALAILHVGVCMGRDVGVDQEVLATQLAHAYAHGSEVVERIPEVLS